MWSMWVSIMITKCWNINYCTYQLILWHFIFNKNHEYSWYNDIEVSNGWYFRFWWLSLRLKLRLTLSTWIALHCYKKSRIIFYQFHGLFLKMKLCFVKVLNLTLSQIIVIVDHQIYKASNYWYYHKNFKPNNEREQLKISNFILLVSDHNNLGSFLSQTYLFKGGKKWNQRHNLWMVPKSSHTILKGS